MEIFGIVMKDIKMKQKLLKSSYVLILAMLTGGNVNAQTCTPSPSCEELGYTKTIAECGDNGIKCPFDITKLFCMYDKNATPIETAKILYSDRTVSRFIYTDKYPIGVVFDEQNRLAVSLYTRNHEAWVNNVWSTVNIPELTDCMSYNYNADGRDELLNCAPDGKKNTAQIIAHEKLSNISIGAAKYCYNYKPLNCKDSWCKDGQWFLPSIGQLWKLFTNAKAVHLTMLALNQPGLDYTQNSLGKIFYSSNEVDASNVWAIQLPLYIFDSSFKIITYPKLPNSSGGGNPEVIPLPVINY